MQPNLPSPGNYPPQSPDQNPANYLDTIATPVPQQTLNPFVLWGLIGGVILVLGLLLMILLTAGGPSRAEQFTNYLHRLDALRTLSSDSAKVIRSSELRGYNSMMGTILAGAHQEGNEFLGEYGIEKLEKPADDSSVSKEFAELATTLDDARLNAVFDRTYAREVAFQLGQVKIELKTLYSDTGDENIKNYLETTDANITPVIEQFDSFSNSQG